MTYAKGHAKCTTSGTLGTNGTRSFHAIIDSGGPVAGDQGNGAGHSDSTSAWDGDAGTSKSVFFYTFESGGTTTTPIADNITVAVYDATGTLVKTISSAIAPPANGTNLGSFTFAANGTSGGDRCGQYEIRITAVRTSGAAGLDNYNVNSATQALQGAIRGNMLVSAIASTSSQDASGTHRYGTAGDNTITTTVTHTQQQVAHANQTVQKLILDATETTLKDKGTSILDTGTSLTWTDVVNNTYSSGSASYGSEILSFGTGPLVNTEKWTIPVAGAGLSQDGVNGVKKSAYYTVAPAIALASIAITPASGGTGIVNRGEVTTITFNIQNSGGTNLTRAMGLQLKNSLGTSVQDTTPTGASYVISYTPSTTDDASFDFVGLQWTFNTNKSDAHNVSSNAYKVSSKLMLGSAVGGNNLVIGTNFEVYNRGEPVVFSNVFLSFARASAYASKSSITREVRTVAQAIEATTSAAATSAGGLLSTINYTPSATDVAAADTTGSLKHLFFSHLGNTTDNSAAEWAVSSLYFAYIRTQLSDTLAGFTYPNMETGSDTDFVILGDTANTWAFVTGVRQDNTDINTTGSAITLRTRKPSGSIDQTFAIDSGPDATNGSRNGWTPNVGINPASPAGIWTYTATVAYFGNAATAPVHSVTYITPLTSNLLTRVLIPTLVMPGQSVTAYLQSEVNDVATVPQTVPTYRIGKVTAGSPDVFSDFVASTQMLSVVTGTAVINGALYRATFAAPTTPGTYEFWTDAQLNGNGIRSSKHFRVSGNAFDATGCFAGPGAA